jgi:hypothetical protein
MNKEYFKKAIPHVVAIAIFLALTLMLMFRRCWKASVFSIRHYETKACRKKLLISAKKPVKNHCGPIPCLEECRHIRFQCFIKTISQDTFTKYHDLGLPRPADMIFLYFIGFYILTAGNAHQPLASHSRCHGFFLFIVSFYYS